MTCDTLIRTEPDGKKIFKKKKAYNTLDEAIAQAKKLNALDIQVKKLVAYKCTYCCKYHIGRNGKTLTEKQKNKFRNDPVNQIQFKILGKINL